MFYIYYQNNSGGFFDCQSDDHPLLEEVVIIEANSAEEANDRAISVGIYFDGVKKDIDCECCGDRWSRYHTFESGSETPQIYGLPVEVLKDEKNGRCFVQTLSGSSYLYAKRLGWVYYNEYFTREVNK